MNSYMEIVYIDTDNNARRTGIGAAMATNAKTWADFRSRRSFAVDKDKAEFLLDYYNRKGDLFDTIFLDRAGFRAITGERIKSDADYRRIDAGAGDSRDE